MRPVRPLTSAFFMEAEVYHHVQLLAEHQHHAAQAWQDYVESL